MILTAARTFLETRPFREMTVEGVMARTGLSRPAFYAYFRDRYEVVTRLLEGIGGLLFALDWLLGTLPLLLLVGLLVGFGAALTYLFVSLSRVGR